jgi:hypothetical protein
MPAVIDGAKDPGAIPDDIAYGHFFRATASSASPQDVSRRKAFLLEAGLTPSDQDAYAQAVEGLKAQLDAVRQQRRAAGREVSKEIGQELQRLETQALADARSRLHARVSPIGIAKLDAHIQNRVKRNIKMFSGPMQPTPEVLR